MVIALVHGFSLIAAVSSSMGVSGSRVYASVTLGTLVGGRISLLRALYYWVAQLLRSVLTSPPLCGHGQPAFGALGHRRGR